MPVGYALAFCSCGNAAGVTCELCKVGMCSGCDVLAKPFTDLDAWPVRVAGFGYVNRVWDYRYRLLNLAHHDGGADGTDGSGARYLEWSWDPDPDDTWMLTAYAFLLREKGGAVRVVHETHRLGLFSRRTWLRLLEEAGFAAQAITEETSEDRQPRELFTGRRR